MAFSPNVWSQLKNKTADDLVSALEHDGWELEPECKGAILVFRHPVTKQRVGIHYHPRKTYGPKLLKGLLEDIGWDEAEMRTLKLIK